MCGSVECVHQVVKSDDLSTKPQNITTQTRYLSHSTMNTPATHMNRYYEFTLEVK